MLNKDQLIFDPAAANTDECDTVGSYILDSAGNAITSTDLGGGVQALDVNVAGGTISLDLDFATDQVDASGSVVALDAATLAALEDINAVVTATDLDIRDLVFATDSVDVSGSSVTAAISGTVDVSGSEVALDAASLAALEDINATVTGTVALDAATLAALEDVTVSATDFDIRDLTAATDSVSISDGTDTLAINADGSINVQFAAAGKQSVVETNNGVANSATTATTTAAAIVTTALADRTKLLIQNNGSSVVYVGDSGVTSTTGVRIPKGGSFEINVSDAVALFAVTASGTADLRVMELACT